MNTFKNAFGKIDYTLTNDYMFRAVMQENETVLKGLVSSLLHLDFSDIRSVTILNPIALGKAFDEKTFVLDIKVLLNNAMVINLEMQVAGQDFWNDRSLIYLCNIFNNLKSGDDYSHVMPACHIGILDFTPFPEQPEFYATNKMMNVRKHYVYNDKFTLNVLDLRQIDMATDEDKAYKLDYLARLFKARTWEDLRMIAHDDDILEQTCETMYNLNQDEVTRYWCEAREDGLRIMRTIQNQYKAEIAEKDSIIAQQQAEIRKLKKALNEKTN